MELTMSTSNYHPMTFLRSSIAKDPFCLGDLGPEDVLRIESYFPEMFKSPSQSPGHKKPSTDKSRNVSSPSCVSQPNLKSARSSTLKLPPSPKKSDTPPYTCSRGSRCGSFNTNLKPLPQPIRGKFPLPSSKPSTLPLAETKSEGVKVMNKSSVIRFTKSDSNAVIPKSPHLCRQTTKRQIPAKPHLGPGKINSNNSPSGIKLISINPVKGLNNHQSNPKPKVSDLPFKLKLRPQLSRVPVNMNTKPKKSKEPLLRLKQGTQEKQKLVENLQNILSSFVKFPEREPSIEVFLPPKSKPTPGFIRPLFVNPVLRRNLKNRPKSKKAKKPDREDVQQKLKTSAIERTDRLEVTKDPDSSYSEDFSIGQAKILLNTKNGKLQVEPNLHFRDDDVSISSNTTNTQSSFKYSAKKIQKPKDSEVIVQNIAERNELLNDSVDRFEQLMMAKLLASKYEKDGKFHIEMSNSKKIDKWTGTRPLEISPFSSTHGCTGTEILEKIAEDLRRGEEFKCIHTEEVKVLKVDKGIGTSSEPLKNGDRTSNLRLTPINEENSIILITPDLTPPVPLIREIYPNPCLPPRDVSEQSISTPKPTLPKHMEEDIVKPTAGVKSKRVRNHHDSTDCSSISDFVLSEAENYKNLDKLPNYIRDSYNQVFEIRTPDWTPAKPLSRVSEPDHDFTLDSIRTPIATRPNSVKNVSEEQFNVHFEKSPKSVDFQVSQPLTPEISLTKSKSKISFAEYLSDFEKSVTSGFQRLYSEIMSDGEFLLSPYKSPGELSLSMTSFSPGLYMSDNDTEDISLSGIDTIAEDTSITFSSIGELRSRRLQF